MRQHIGLARSFWKAAHGYEESESSLFTAAIPVPGFPGSRPSKGKGREGKTMGGEAIVGASVRNGRPGNNFTLATSPVVNDMTLERHSQKGPQLPGNLAPTVHGEELQSQRRQVAGLW